MCWEATRKSNRWPRIATKDIPVFKIGQLRNGCVTPYFYSDNVIYSEGKTYVQPIWNFLWPKRYRGIGIHCYSNECTITTEYSCFVEVEGPFNGIKKPYLQEYSLKPSVKMEAVIPKGTIFFQNDNGEMVTTRLRIGKMHVVSKGIL